MKKIVLFCFLTFNFQLLTFNCLASTSIYAGNVTGTWTLSGSPYLILGNITIADATTLIIQPGVTVNFQGTYKLAVQGRLLAIGTAADTIIFTAANTTNGWRGIRFDNTPATNDTSKIVYCKLQYGKATGSSPDDKGGAFYFNNFSKAIISNSRISNNISNSEGGGIYCLYSSPNISNNTISNNLATDNSIWGNGGGIFCQFSSPTILNNNISNNTAASTYNGGGGGICCFSQSNPTISNNLITNNTASGNDISAGGGGIHCLSTCSPTISNNSISNNNAANGGALYCRVTSNPILRNNILFGNTAITSGTQVFLYDEGSDPNFYYCDVQGGTAAFELNGNSFTGIYQNNIDTDPKFVSPSGGSGTGFNGVVADWSLQSNSPCINTGDPNGTYTYPATDKAGNARVTVCRIDMGAYEYQNGIPLTATISQTQQILCYGDSTAKALVAPAGGTPTYTYLLSNGQTTATAIGLKAATYTVTVTETSYSCSITKIITIAQPQKIVFTPIPNPVLCKNGNTGSIIGINAIGGTGTLQYSKDSGNTYQSTNIFTGLTAGHYQVVLKDANNCVTSAQSTVITEPPLLSFTTTKSNVLCKNGNSGSDTVHASGGTGIKQYSKDGGLTYQSSTIFNGLTAGTYQITVKDSNNCVAPVQSVIITEPDLLSFTTKPVNVLCNNGNSGSDTVNASGGNGIFQYSKDGGLTYQSSNIFTGLAASTCQVVVKDSNNCVTSSQADTISQPNALSLLPGHVDVKCFGQSNGYAIANASSGTSPYTYLWNTVPAQSTDTTKYLSAGTYTIMVTDSHNCTATDSVTIASPTVLSIRDSIVTNASCINNDGNALALPQGGTAPYTYLWSNGNHNQSLTGIGSGTYSVTATDHNGCFISDTLIINNSIAPGSIPICMVTVDSGSAKNVIVWEKPINATIDSFRIYREIASVYSRVGSVSYNALSEFTDNTNGINPNTTSYKYKLSVLDTCGNESPLSANHQTVHVQLGVAFPQGVNLSWNDYIGFTFSQYRILRDNLGNNSWQVIDSVSYGITTYTSTDVLPNARYIVEAKRPTACVSTRQSNTRNSSKSNTASQATGINELSNDMAVMIYPNPSNGRFTLQIDNGKLTMNNYHLSVYNVLGERIYLAAIKRQTFNEIDLSTAPKGIYFLKIYDGDKIYTRKIVKQ